MDPVLYWLFGFLLWSSDAAGIYWLVRMLKAGRKGPVSTKVAARIEPFTRKGVLVEYCPRCAMAIKHYDFKARFPTFEEWTVRQEKDAGL